jgi:hypothetical protein
VTLTTSGIDYTFDVAFGVDPLAIPGGGDWVDVTTYVRQFSTRRGRNHELGRTQAGVCSITLDNRDRRFDPTYTSGPYYPEVVPMAHVRIRATYASVTYPVFYGFVEDWGQGWPGPAANAQGDAVVELQASDAFNILERLTLTPYSEQVLSDDPLVYYLFADPAGTTEDARLHNLGSAGDDDIFTEGFTDTTFGVSGPLLGGATAVAFGGAGYGANLSGPGPLDDTAVISLPRDLTLETWFYADTFTDGDGVFSSRGQDVASALFCAIEMDGAGGDMRFIRSLKIGPAEAAVVFNSNLAVSTWYHLAFTVGASRVTMYVDGVEISSAGMGATPRGNAEAWGLIGSSGSFTSTITSMDGRLAHLAIWDRALSAETIASHAAIRIDQFVTQGSGAAIGAVLDAANWPVGLRDLDTGVATLVLGPTGSALDLLQRIAEDTEHGLILMAADNDVTFVDRAALEGTFASVATFGDGAGEVGYHDLGLSYDDQDLWTEVSASGADGAKVVVSDATAVARYGTRTLEVSGATATANEVADVANGLLARYKDPHTRPVALVLNKPAAFTQQLSRLIGDRVTVKRRPPGGGTITVDALIEGIDHDAGPDGWLTTTFHLVPTEPQVPWILGNATYGILGSTTRLGW